MIRAGAKTKLLVAVSAALTTGWAATLAYLVRESVYRRSFAEFILPFFAYGLLMGAIAALSIFRSKAVRFFRYGILCFCVLSAIAIPIFFRYYRKIKSRFSDSDIFAIFQSHADESSHYFVEYILTQQGIILAVACVILAFIVVKVNSSAISRLNIKKSTLAVLIACSVSSAFILLSQCYVVKKTYTSYRRYHADLEDFHRLSLILANQPTDASLKKEKGEIYVIVIGESESRDFMHCYSGPAENTPWLDTLREQPDWVIFENAYSFQTHTLPILQAALSNGRALTGLTFPKGQNIIGISKQADITATWLSNQAPVGEWDNPVSALAHSADNTHFATKTHSYQLAAPPPDAILLPAIEQALRQADSAGNSLLLIHLMGSHGPYHRRYPESFPPMRVNEANFLGRLAEKEQLKKKYQEYLTSIRHTDAVLKSIHDLVARHADRPAVLLYFADHGEDVFSRGGGHDFNSFTWSMARIPMYLWVSQAYQERYPDKVFSVRANREKVFTNDLLYDLYLGLASIQSESYLAEYDISSEKYSLTWDNAVIDAGKQPRTDPAVIAAQNFTLEHGPRLAAHRVNSLFKLKQAQGAGLRNFEVDVRYEEREGRATLQVGHNPESMAGMEFAEYVESLAQGFDFLWVDIKNLSEKNNASVLTLLNDLDATYGLRSKVLLETPNPQAAGILADAAWSTGYYLEWQALTNALAAGEEESLRKMSADIGALVRQHGIGAVSYDLKADAAVKKYVLPQLPSGTTLYAWNTEWTFSDPDLPDKIRPYEHLSLLLVRYPSPFDI